MPRKPIPCWTGHNDTGSCGNGCCNFPRRKNYCHTSPANTFVLLGGVHLPSWSCSQLHGHLSCLHCGQLPVEKWMDQVLMMNVRDRHMRACGCSARCGQHHCSAGPAPRMRLHGGATGEAPGRPGQLGVSPGVVRCPRRVRGSSRPMIVDNRQCFSKTSDHPKKHSGARGTSKMWCDSHALTTAQVFSPVAHCDALFNRKPPAPPRAPFRTSAAGDSTCRSWCSPVPPAGRLEPRGACVVPCRTSKGLLLAAQTPRPGTPSGHYSKAFVSGAGRA